MADRFVVGDTVTLTNTFAVAGTNTDPSTVTLAVTDPTGTATTYTYAGSTITKTATGVYTRNVTASTAGVWIYTWTGTGTAADVANGSFTVDDLDAYPLTEYATLDELKGYLSAGGNVTLAAADDVVLSGAIKAASRRIDGYCRRRFHRSATATARTYVPDCADELAVDPISTTTGLVIATDTTGDGTFDTTWTSDDYQPEPLNGTVDGIDVWPFTLLRAVGDYRFPPPWRGRATVQVTARWGWAAVPAPVHQACLIQAAYLFRRKDAVTGILGATDFGSVRVRSGLDPDAADLLTAYRLAPAVA